MSMNDERPGAAAGMVRDRIEAALGLMQPPAAPVAAVISRGRRIRLRRWVAGAAAFAVAVAAAVTVPLLAHLPGHRVTPVTRPTTPPKVTITPIGPHAPRDLIAAGTINGRPWTIRIVAGPTLQVTGQPFVALGGGAAGTGTTSDPWSTVEAGGGTGYYLAGAVAPQVTRLSLELSDGQRLTLVPVQHRIGARGKVTPWTGVVLPRQLKVTKVVAYSRHGVLAYAIPFNGAGQNAIIQNWLRPGQQVPGRLVRVIGSGKVSGRRWSVTVHRGPWGWCAIAAIPGASGTTGCWSSAGREGPIMSSGGSPAAPWFAVGAARPGVSYVTLTLSNGAITRIPVVTVDGARLFVALFVGKPRIASWSEYDHAGRRVAGGSGTPAWARQ